MPVCLLGRYRKEVRWQGELWDPAVDRAEASGERLWGSCWKARRATRLVQTCEPPDSRKGRVKISPRISQKLNDQKTSPMTKQDAYLD